MAVTADGGFLIADTGNSEVRAVSAAGVIRRRAKSLHRALPVFQNSSKNFPETVEADRPGLAAALDYLRPGDTLAVWKLDRLGRSVKDVLIIADDLHERGIGLRILTGKLSGSYSPTGEGKFFFTRMAVFAELARHHPRTNHGRAGRSACTQGRNGGGPTVMDADKLAAARARRERGENPTEIAKALGVSRASIYRHLGAESDEG